MFNINDKNSNAVLAETQELFQSQGMSILGEGYKEIATNPILFENYVESLCQGVGADNYESMKALMENSNKAILTESSTTGIAPIAALSMPVIRKLWPKFALKDAVKKEVAKAPRFVVSYMRPYMFRAKENGTEEKHYLPYAVKETSKGVMGKDLVIRTVKLTNGSANVDFKVAPDAVEANVNEGCALLKTAGSMLKVQPLDRDFYVEYNGTKYTLDINNTVVVEDEDENVTILVKVNLQAATAKVAVISGNEVTVKLVAPLSTEFNEQSWSVGLDLERMDISIPTGQHINAPLAIEALQDLMALYQIDGTKEVTDQMTNIFAMQLDLDILNFLKDSYLNQPKEYPHGDGSTLKTAVDFTFSFDVRPSAGFAGGPKAWREQLKPQIDFLAQSIKNATYLNTGMFVIVGNPLDVMLISNIDWQFRGGQGSNVDGVDIDYSVGTYVGANTYKIISSQNVPQGAMFVLFLPASDKQMTYKYYPYTFCVEHGYIDPNRSRVPSIMMTKRHQFKSFLPAIGAINIINNDGMGQFAPYIQHKEWTAADWGADESYTGAPSVEDLYN